MADLFAAIGDILVGLRPASTGGRAALGCATAAFVVIALGWGAVEILAALGH